MWASANLWLAESLGNCFVAAAVDVVECIAAALGSGIAAVG